MKALVIYDSFFGNTEEIARAIGTSLASAAEVAISRVTEVEPDQLSAADLVIVGSPTRAFRPTPAIKGLLKSLPPRSLAGVKAAAFDTRIATGDIKSGALRLLVKIGGYAAGPIAALLRKKGGGLVVEPEGFLVADTEGPLKAGELERAVLWAERIAPAEVR